MLTESTEGIDDLLDCRVGPPDVGSLNGVSGVEGVSVGTFGLLFKAVGAIAGTEGGKKWTGLFIGFHMSEPMRSWLSMGLLTIGDT